MASPLYSDPVLLDVHEARQSLNYETTFRMTRPSGPHRGAELKIASGPFDDLKNNDACIRLWNFQRASSYFKVLEVMSIPSRCTKCQRSVEGGGAHGNAQMDVGRADFCPASTI